MFYRILEQLGIDLEAFELLRNQHAELGTSP